MRSALQQAVCAGTLACVVALDAAAGDLQFTASRDGALVKVSASVDLPVDRVLAWKVLTDYDHYADFISGLVESRVVERTPEGLVIEQKGDIGVLFFRQAAYSRMLVTEQPPTAVISRGLGGTFRDLSGRYELQPVASGVRLTYTGSFVPEFFLPPLVGMAVVHHTLERNFSELAAEIVRRAGAPK